jgi:GT2 family glycosyltransferase
VANDLPSVTAVFLAYNRKEQLRESLRRMHDESGYPADRLAFIVVDNASSDGTAAMVRREYPGIRVIETGANLGAPGWNAGFRVADSDYVVILDDDAYLPTGALEQAVQAAREHDAGLVSFTIVSAYDETYRFNDRYPTGLLSYWGCAALVSRAALHELGGYDPNIFIWGNELEFTMRLLDRGYVHVHLPDVHAVHMKEPVQNPVWEVRGVRNNCRHWGYVVGRLMRPRDAILTAWALASWTLVEGLARDRTMLKGFVPVWGGFIAGLRNRDPVRPIVSATYRRNFHSFDWPWRYWRTPAARWRASTGRESADAQRRRPRAAYFGQRRRFYPEGRAALRL